MFYFVSQEFKPKRIKEKEKERTWLTKMVQVTKQIHMVDHQTYNLIVYPRFKCACQCCLLRFIFVKHMFYFSNLKDFSLIIKIFNFYRYSIWGLGEISDYSFNKNISRYFHKFISSRFNALS